MLAAGYGRQNDSSYKKKKAKTRTGKSLHSQPELSSGMETTPGTTE
jgi:hypothetical protein